MNHSLLRLPDIKIDPMDYEQYQSEEDQADIFNYYQTKQPSDGGENTVYHLTIKGGVPVKMYNSGIRSNYRFLSAFVIDVLQNNADYFEDQDVEYQPFVDYCATELEGNEVTKVVKEILRYRLDDMQSVLPSGIIPVRTDKTLRKYKKVFDEWYYEPCSGYPLALMRSLKDITNWSGTAEYITTMFRESESWRELYDEINGLTTHITKIEELYWDSIKKILLKYLKEHGKWARAGVRKDGGSGW